MPSYTHLAEYIEHFRRFDDLMGGSTHIGYRIGNSVDDTIGVCSFQSGDMPLSVVRHILRKKTIYDTVSRLPYLDPRQVGHIRTFVSCTPEYVNAIIDPSARTCALYASLANFSTLRARDVIMDVCRAIAPVSQDVVRGRTPEPESDYWSVGIECSERGETIVVYEEIRDPESMIASLGLAPEDVSVVSARWTPDGWRGWYVCLRGISWACMAKYCRSSVLCDRCRAWGEDISVEGYTIDPYGREAIHFRDVAS